MPRSAQTIGSVAFRRKLARCGPWRCRPRQVADRGVHARTARLEIALDHGAHEHADVRFALVTQTPEAIAAESDAALLEWLELQEAMARTAEDNLRETLARLQALLP